MTDRPTQDEPRGAAMAGRQCQGRRRAAAVLLWALPAFAAAQVQDTPPGEPKSPTTRALELGSRLLQDAPAAAAVRRAIGEVD